MGRTKQTAKKSTGGKRIPRSYLAEKSARFTQFQRNAQISRLWPLLNRKDAERVWWDLQAEEGREFTVEFRIERDGAKRFRISERDFTFLFGTHVAAFVKNADVPYLDVATAQRLSLTESIEDNNDYDGRVDSSSWTIDKLWFSKGLEGKEIPGCYYATELGREGVYQIDLYTFQISGSHHNRKNHSVTDDSNYWHGTLKSRISGIMTIDSWCSNHPGSRMALAHSKSREPSDHCIPFFDKTGKVCFRDDTDQCIRSSFFNGMRLVMSESLAASASQLESERMVRSQVEKGWRPRVRDFRDMQKICKEFVRDLSLNYVKDSLGNHKDPDWRFFVERKRPGIYVLTVRSVCDFGHAICIDTNQDPPIIYDSSEDFPMRCTRESLALCVGDTRKFSRIQDVRELVMRKVKHPTKGTGRNRYIDKNKKRRKREALEREKAKKCSKT